MDWWIGELVDWRVGELVGGLVIPNALCCGFFVLYALWVLENSKFIGELLKSNGFRPSTS